MGTYSLSGTRKRGKFGAIAALVGSMLGISFIAFIVGLLTGVDASLSIRLVAVISVPMLLLLAWVAPKGKGDPSARLYPLLYGLIIAAVFWPPYAIFSIHGLPSMEPKRLLLLSMFVLWIYKIVTSPELFARLRRRLSAGGLPLVLLIGFLLWRMASIFSSNQPIYSLIQIGWDLINYYLIFFVALSVIRDFRDVRALVMLLIVSTFIVAIIGVIERLVGHNLFAQLVPPNEEFTMMTAAALADKVREGGTRVQSTFEHPMMLAEFLVFAMPLFVFGALRMQQKIFRVVCLSSLLFVFGVIFMSGTRSAIVTGAVVLALALTLYFLRNVRGKALSFQAFFSVLGLLVLVIGMLASVSVLTQLIQGRNAGEKGSSASRMLQLQSAVPKLEKQPVLGYGVGMGNSTLGFKASNGALSTDNYYLTLSLDSGVPAAALFLMSGLAFCWLGIPMYFSKKDNDGVVLAGMLSLSLIGVMVTKSVLSIERNLLFFNLGCAILVILREQFKQPALEHRL